MLENYGIKPYARIHEFDGFGHFVQEEIGEELCPIIERFLMKS